MIKSFAESPFDVSVLLTKQIYSILVFKLKMYQF